MKKSERGQALIDFLLLLVVLIGIPLVLIFRYDAQLRNVSARAVRATVGMIRSWRGAPRRPAAKPAAKAQPEAPAAKPAVPAEKAKPAAPATPVAPATAPAAAPVK